MIRSYFTIDYNSFSKIAGSSMSKEKKSSAGSQKSGSEDQGQSQGQNAGLSGEVNLKVKFHQNQSPAHSKSPKIPYEIKNWIIIASVHVIGVIIIEIYNNKVLHKHKNYTFSMVRVVSVALADFIVSNYMYFFENCGWESLGRFDLAGLEAKRGPQTNSSSNLKSHSNSNLSEKFQKISALSGQRPKFTRSKTVNFKAQNVSDMNEYTYLSSSSRRKYSSDSTGSNSEEINANRANLSDLLPGAIIAAGVGLAAFLGAERLKKL